MWKIEEKETAFGLLSFSGKEMLLAVFILCAALVEMNQCGERPDSFMNFTY